MQGVPLTKCDETTRQPLAARGRTLMGGLFTPRWVSLSARSVVDHFDDSHHAEILMAKDVAVVDVLAGEVEEARPDHDLAKLRDRGRVFPGVRIHRFAVDRHN